MLGRLLHRTRQRLDRTVGGAARRRVIIVFAVVLALSSADSATIGANTTQLQSGLGIDKTDIGLLLTVSALVGALATIPAGVLVDRVDRTALLAAAVALWGAAMVLSGVATGYLFLLLARVALGAVTAVAAPAIASLIGDYFPEHERGRIYGYVLSGELVGAGFGFLIAGQFASLSWRAPFFALVPPTVLVWWLAWRLPEPKRGGASRLSAAGARPDDDSTDLAAQMVRRSGVEPRPQDVLRADPQTMSLRAAIRYVLQIRSNVVLIVASALGYFFFTGLRAFGVEYLKDQYGLPQSAATALIVVLGVAALGGVLLGGRAGDRLLARGRITARVEIPGGAALLSAVLFAIALLMGQLWIAMVLLAAAAVCLGATNPPLDAARLDIMPGGLWGRAEAVRSALRDSADAVSPLLFGVVSTALFGGGLQYTFLVMLVSLFAAAPILLLAGRRTYPADVAAAAATSPAAPPDQHPQDHDIEGTAS